MREHVPALKLHAVKQSTRNIIEAALAGDSSATETTKQFILSAADGIIPQRDDRLPLPVWCRKEELQRLTGCPDKWLFDFARVHPNDFRKYATAQNGSAVYRVAAVLDEIENLKASEEVRA